MSLLNLNFNTIDSLSKPGGTPLDFAFSASIVVVGGGGGGKAGQGPDNQGGGGTSGQLQYVNVKIVPNLYYTANQIGTGGIPGISTPGLVFGGSGSFTSFTYPIGPKDINGSATLISSGGLGGSSGGNGAGQLYGGAGAPQNDTSPQNGGCCNSILDSVVGVTTFSGSGGRGGVYQSNTLILPIQGIFGGGGGGGAGTPVTTSPGASGGQGIVAVVYNGQPKMLITNGYTDYVSGSNITYHYITGSGGTFIFPYPYPWPDVTGSIIY